MMSPAEAAVKDIYFNALDKLNMMLLACRNDEERAAIRLEFTRARSNFYTCVNKAFAANDQALDELVVQANRAANDLKQIEEHLGNIAKVLDAMTQAVTYGSQIAAKVLAV